MDDAARYNFKREFEERSGDTVLHMTMARAYGNSLAILASGLEIAPGRKDIWGLLIFGEKNIHFFVHASETAMGALLRSAARAEAPKEQWAVFPKERIKGISSLQRGKGFLSFLLQKLSVVELSFIGAKKEESSFEKPESSRAQAVHTLYFETLVPVKSDLLPYFKLNS